MVIFLIDLFFFFFKKNQRSLLFTYDTHIYLYHIFLTIHRYVCSRTMLNTEKFVRVKQQLSDLYWCHGLHCHVANNNHHRNNILGIIFKGHALRTHLHIIYTHSFTLVLMPT